ncbi:hypothetical protein [Kitasatospora sp. NPDC093679]|uniref:hypothetical protein n=1 Tax=Kitasatospora sp. NPDC093679 TaxID=3154983 RepID=UPI003419CA4A
MEVEHEVQSKCADRAEQACGQDTASLTVLAAETETQPRVAVDGQARQVLATPVDEFDRRLHMVREVAIAGLKNWRALARHHGRRDHLSDTIRAVAGLLSDQQAVHTHQLAALPAGRAA